ncbi:MAG: aminoglycoside phosphotransferase family protein [Candidatus Eisenbacteria bacterium]|uniref:Aminoglycoside phosphotransferase family protein n=1 Tax=Eiseniibacteriota bacterium TaxID=2212470 RepID=A0A538U625_UNCEI|nr:MAG: aminoglycoside phosphotransferase family protein [Candidatus Eisenbacteria bacterium]
MRLVPEIPAEHAERLGSLEVALDGERMKAVLEPHARARFGAGFVIEAIDIAVRRRHVNRYVVRYAIRGRTGARGRAQRFAVIGKVLDRGRGETLHRNMGALWEHGFGRGAADRVAIPRPIEYLPELALQIQEEVGGSSVRDLLKRGPDPRHFTAAGRALAKLHRCSVSLGPPRNVEDHLARCHPRHPVLAEASDAWAEAVGRIVAGARRVEPRFGAVVATPVHGDFHLGQVHVAGERAWLIDLDTVGMADPASDLGNLLVFLEDKARRRAAVAPLMEAFLDAYFAAGMDRGILARVPLYQALTHLRRACKSLRRGCDGWQDRIRGMLDLGVAAIETAERQWP